MRNIYVVILIFLSMACAVAAKEQKGYLSVKNSNLAYSPRNKSVLVCSSYKIQGQNLFYWRMSLHHATALQLNTPDNLFCLVKQHILLSITMVRIMMPDISKSL